MVCARARVKVGGFASPLDGDRFMSMHPEGNGTPGGWVGTWEGRCEVEEWGKDEVSALAALFEELDYRKLPICGTAIAVAAALAEKPGTVGAGTRESNGTREDWELRPLGARGPCPRRMRHLWRDKNTGARVRIYADTLRRHDDPNCTCPHCAYITTQPAPDDTPP